MLTSELAEKRCLFFSEKYTTEYSYDSTRKQMLNSVGANSYTFDLFGNMASDGVRTYSFDWNNRPVSVTKSSLTTNYYYGHDGLRVKKVTPSTTSYYPDTYTELRGSSVYRHIMLNGSTIASFDDSGVVTYNHKDHLGSSNLRTDSMGAILKHIEYYPFGTKRSDIGSFDDLKHNFTGQYEDDESDLLYYKQRYYDPQLGRFISADPLYLEEMDKRGVNSQELNLYAYVGNNPLNRVDPDGLAFEDQGGSIFAYQTRGSPGQLSGNFASYYGVPVGTNSFNMEHMKDINSPEFAYAMANDTSLRNIGITMGVIATGGLAFNAAPFATTLATSIAARYPDFFSNASDFISGLITGASGDAPDSLSGMTGNVINWTYSELSSDSNSINSSFESYPNNTESSSEWINMNMNNYSFGDFNLDSSAAD